MGFQVGSKIGVCGILSIILCSSDVEVISKASLAFKLDGNFSPYESCWHNLYEYFAF